MFRIEKMRVFVFHSLSCLLACGFLLTTSSRAQDNKQDEKQQAEEAKRQSEQGRPASPQPPPAGAQEEADRRKALERDAQPPIPGESQVTATDEEIKKQVAAQVRPAQVQESGDPRQEAIERFDWKQVFRTGGLISDELRLSLALPPVPYGYGPRYYVYLGLTNQRAARRTIEAMRGASLGRTEALVFRVQADDGTEIVTSNRYLESAVVRIKPALQLEANGQITDVVDFNELVTTSSILFDLVQRSKRLVITAEVSGLNLKSNAVEIQLQGK